MNIRCFSLGLCFFVLTIQSVFSTPTVTSISPTHGDISGGNAVTITGTGFTGASNVDFGFRPASSYVVVNDTTINAVVPVGTVGTFDVTVTAMAVTSPTSNNDYYTYTTTGWRGIVSVDTPNQVFLFNTDTNSFTASIPSTAASHTSVINPAGTIIYNADEAIPSISVIDAATYTIIATIPTDEGAGSFDMVINPTGTRLYISNINNGFVTVIDTTNNTILTDISVFNNIGPISITPDGSTVYVSNFFGGIFPIDTATNTVLPLIVTDSFPGKIAITPDGTKAYVPIYNDNEVWVYDLPAFVQTNTISVAPSTNPYGASILPNSQTLYVANANSTVTVIDLATETVTTTINLVPPLQPNAGAFWLASTPDSKKVFVISEFDPTIVSIDVATNTIGASFVITDGSLQDLVISPDPAPVAYFSADPQIIGTPTVFDASASLSPIGSIVSYAWNFGDGQTLVSTSPIVSHTYTVPGNYNVTLTVTNSAGTSTTKVFSSGFMSNNGGPTATRTRIIAALGVPGPINAIGFQIRCRFPSQTNIINILEWSPPVGYAPVAYLIFRDAALTQLIGNVPGNQPLIFEDPNRKKKETYTYYIVAVNSSGELSSPAVVTIKPKS